MTFFTIFIPPLLSFPLSLFISSCFPPSLLLSLSVFVNLEFVTTAINNNGLSLKHASPELQNDKDIVTAAVKNNGYAFGFASEKLQKDHDYIKFLMDNSDLPLTYVALLFED